MFKAGDKVRVVSSQHGIEPMEKLVGSTCTIKEYCNGYYTLIEDHGVWAWFERWLEPAELEKEFKIEEESILNLLGDEYAAF